MSSAALAQELRAIGLDRGLEDIGICSVEVFADTRAALHERKAEGLHADMQFTYRNPDRATAPADLLPGARSLVVGALSYRRAQSPPPDAEAGVARIGEYVWESYYEQLRDALGAVAEHLSAAGYRTRILIDDNALVDRAAAYRAGIGWYGKNSNILIPGKGSRFVLGSIVTDAIVEPARELVADACGPCRRCIENCPTDAIVSDGTIDSNRCLAWLVQAKGDFPLEFREALGDRIYGCDDCQSTCPPNLLHDRAEPPPATTGDVWVALQELLTLDDAALLERFGVWYIPGREPRYLRRNALVVLGNVGDSASSEVRALVERYVASDDPIEKSHAEWAAEQLGYLDLLGVGDGP